MGRLIWSIATVVSGSPLRLPSFAGVCPALRAESIRDAVATFVADPFLVFRDGCWHMFFELMNAGSGRGEIGCASSLDGLSWSYGQVVIREKFHLSFPSLLEADGELFMVPESRADRTIRLYRCLHFPADWKCEAILMRGDFADPSIFRHEGYFWLLAQRGLDESCLYFSESLRGSWKPHPFSPLWAGNQSYSRPAGRIFRHADALYRPVQDGVHGYGRCVRLMTIDELSPAFYVEREAEASPLLLPTRTGWNADAAHHLDAHPLPDGSWLAAVDGARVTSR